MPMCSHSSLMTLLSKLAPWSLKSLTRVLKVKMYPSHRNFAMVFTVWSGVTLAMTFFIKWLWKTRTFTTFGGWGSYIITSMLMKSMCSSSKGVVAMMGCISALVQVHSCWMHCLQLPIAFCICMAMLGHQNQSCSRYSINCWPWCPASQWHPFIAATWWAVGTINHRTYSSSVYGSDRGLLDRASAFPALKGWPLPPQCLHYLLKSSKMLQILYFLIGDPIDCSLKYWIFPLSGHPISQM